MILIADSGATKTEWRIIQDKKTITQVITEGINPHYQSSEQISNLLKEAIKSNKLPGTEGEVYFYGAGCSSKDKIELVSNALQSVFPNSQIEVQADIIGVARSLCGHQKGIVGILGTGSASCLYDGNEIVQQVPSLGYILGDEGSGAHLGKLLISAYLRGELPQKLAEKFYLKFQVDKESILKELNSGKTPSRYLGSFAKFIGSHIHDPFLNQMVYHSLKEFIEKYISPYLNAGDLKVHFCGSIAFYFSNILSKVCIDQKIPLGRIVQSPIAGLTLYHVGEI